MSVSSVNSISDAYAPNFFLSKTYLLAIAFFAGVAIGWGLKTYFTRPPKINPQPGSSNVKKEDNSVAQNGSSNQSALTPDTLMSIYQANPKNISLYLDNFTCKIGGNGVKIEKGLALAFLKQLSAKIVKSQNSEEIANAVAMIDRIIPVTVQGVINTRFLELKNKPVFKWIIDKQTYQFIVDENNCSYLKDAYNRYLILSNSTVKSYFTLIANAAKEKDLSKCKNYWNWFVDRGYKNRMPSLSLNRSGNQFTLKAGSKMYCGVSAPKEFSSDPDIKYVTTTHNFTVDHDFADQLESLA